MDDAMATLADAAQTTEAGAKARVQKAPLLPAWSGRLMAGPADALAD